MSVFWLASLYVPVGLAVVWLLRKYLFPHGPPDDDIDLRLLADGLLVLAWPLVAVICCVVGLLMALGWLASPRSDDD